MQVRYRFLEDDKHKGLGLAYEGYGDPPDTPFEYALFIHGKLEGVYQLNHCLDELVVEDAPEYLISETTRWGEIHEIEFDDVELDSEDFDWSPDDLLIEQWKKYPDHRKL